MNFKALVVFAVGLLACADLERGPDPRPSDAAATVVSDGGAAPTFAALRPLLVAGCGSCHAPGASAGSTAFVVGVDPAADHRNARALVEPTNATASRLAAKAAGQGHGGGAPFPPSSSEHAALLAWISAGALP